MATRNLPSHSLPVSTGLVTKFTKQTVAGQALSVARNVDGYGEFRGLGVIPGDTAVSADHGAAVVSLHQYEFTDLQFARQRQQLSLAADGVLRLIDPGTGALSSLHTGLSSEPLRAVTLLDRLHLSSPAQRALRTGGIKYDGTNTSDWGVLAPGLTESAFFDFDSDSSSWTDSADATSSDIATSIDGGGSLQFDKDGTGSADATITQGSLTLDLSTAGEDTIYGWFYVPPGALQKLASTQAVTLAISDDGGTTTQEYRWDSGALLPGWNLLSAVLTSPDAGSGVSLAAIDWVQLQVSTINAATTQSGFLFDHWHTRDEGRVTATPGSTAGNVEGTVSYRVTYLTEYGVESNSSPISTAVTPAGVAAEQNLDITGVPEDGETVTIDSITYTWVDSVQAGDNAYQVHIGATAAACRDNLKDAINLGPDAGVKSSEILLFTGLPAANDTVTIGGRTYTWVLSPSSAGHILRGASAAECRDTLRKAINGTGVPGVDYHSGTLPQPDVTASDSGTQDLLVEANFPGTYGDGIAVAESASNVAWTAAATSLSGGVESDYGNQTPLHPTVSASDGTGDDLTATAKVLGTGGNALAVSETSTNMVWDGSTLAGGSDGNSVALSDIPVSPDSQVIARRIYRDTGTDFIFRFVAQIDNNVDTTFTDTVPANSLGLASPPIAGDDTTDNTPPPRFAAVAVHEDRIVGIDADNPLVLWLSETAQPEAFRLVDQLQFEEALVALEKHSFGTLVHSTDKTFLLTGDGRTSQFFVEEVNPQLGTNTFRSGARVKGLSVTQRENELFLVADPRDPWHLNGAILDKFEAMTSAQLSNIHVQHDRSRFRVVVFNGTDTAWVYQYGTSGQAQVTGDGAGVDPQDIRNGFWYQMELPTGRAPACSEMVERDADKPELWVGSPDGFVRWLQDPDAATWGDSEFVYAPVPLGRDADGRGRPRYISLDFETTNESTWTITFTMMEGPGGKVVGSPVTRTVTANGRSTPVLPLGVPYNAEWVQVGFSNAVAGDDGDFSNIRLFFVPRRVDFRGPRSA